MIKYMKSALAVSALAVVTMFATADHLQASTITIIDLPPAPPTFAEMTMSCPDGCVGLIGDPATFSPDSASAYEIKPSDETTIASFFGALTGTDASLITVNKTDVPAGDDGEYFSFDVVAGYFFAKFGELTAFFFTDKDQTVTFAKGPGGPAGLSNYGTISVIPLPAAGVLLLSAIGGMALMRRRRKEA